MNQRIGIAVEVRQSSRDLVRAMALRCGRIQLADDWRDVVGVITDDPDLALEAAGRQKGVLFWTPWSVEPATRSRLAASTRIKPAHALRCRPDVVPIKQATLAGKLGEPGLLRLHHWWHGSVIGQHDVAAHLDLAAWLVDERPSVVYATHRGDYRQVHLGFPSDAMALIVLDVSTATRDRYCSIQLIGSRGAAYADDHHNMNLRFGDQGTTALPFSMDSRAQANLIDGFVAALAEGRDFTPNWLDTESAIAWADHAQRAATSQQAVRVGNV